MIPSAFVLGAVALFALLARQRSARQSMSNPQPLERVALTKLGRLSPSERKALERAKRISQRFHGSASQVVELSREERKPLPRFVPVAGELADFTYAPSSSSKRGAVQWRHKSGNRGMGKPESPNRPLLVVDPKTKRPAIVTARSPMRLDSKRGFVG